MRRKPRTLGTFRDAVPPPATGCRGLCMDVECPTCWGDFFAADDLEAFGELPPLRVVVEMEDAVYAALDAAAAGLCVPIEEAAAVREWADRRKARP
jgi:hypothetical protein